jgi:hypothetical protein
LIISRRWPLASYPCCKSCFGMGAWKSTKIHMLVVLVMVR